MVAGPRRVGFQFGAKPWLRKAFIFLRGSPANIIVTLTDLNYKVIFSCSSGSIEGTKKFRRSVYVLEPLFLKLLIPLRHHRVSFLDIMLRMRVGSHVFSFIKECSSHGFKVTRLIERYNLPHNGVRSRRRPRK